MCAVDNSTYVDCPIGEDFEGTFILTSYNPATVTQSMQRIKVPPADYSVEVFDQTVGKWNEVKTNLICSDYTKNLNVTQRYEACTLYISTVAPANSKTYMKVTKSESDQSLINQVTGVNCISTST